MKCLNCGNECDDNARFCTNCGQALDGEKGKVETPSSNDSSWATSVNNDNQINKANNQTDAAPVFQTYNPGVAPLNQGYNPTMNQTYNASVNQTYNAPVNQAYNAPVNQAYNPTVKQDYDAAATSAPLFGSFSGAIDKAPAEEVVEVNVEKVTEKTIVEANIEKSTEEPVVEAAEEVTEETVEKATEKVTEETVEEAAEEVVEETVGEVADEVTEETETAEEATDEVTEETVEEATEKVTEETVEEATEKVTEETIEEVTEKFEEETAAVEENIPVNQAYNPGAAVNQAYNPGAAVNQAYNPGAAVNQTYNPGAAANQAYNPGAAANQAYNPGTAVNQTYNPGAAPANGATPTNKKKVPTGLIIGVIVGLVVLAILATVFKSLGKNINLDSYVTIQAEGYDGYGEADYTIDWTAIEEKYGKSIKFSKEGKSLYGDYITPIEFLQSVVSISFDQRKNLSNGDKLAYTWSIDKEDLKYVDCKLKYTDGSYEVTGLKEIEKFDIFADMEVTFSGSSPNGYVEYFYSGEVLTTYDFTCDKTTGLSNGDVITISIDDETIAYYAEYYGKVPETSEKQYTVEGLQEVISSVNDISTEFINSLKKEAEDAIVSKAAQSLDNSKKLSDISYYGYVMKSPKATDDYVNSENSLFLVYSALLTDKDDSEFSKTIYIPVAFINVSKTGDEFSYETNYGVVGNTFVRDYEIGYIIGYPSILSCYLNISEANEDINIECGDGLETCKEYAVAGNLSDVTDEFKESIQKDAKNQIKYFVKQKYDSDAALDDFEYVGDYLLTEKSKGTTDYTNEYIVVIAATLSSSSDNFSKIKVYFPVTYKGLYKLASGEATVAEFYEISGLSDIPDSYYLTYGYVDGEIMYTELITARRDEFTYEVSEGLQQFGK